MIFQGFLAHDVIDVLFPFVFGFAEFVDSFAQGAKQFGNFLGTEKKKNDKKVPELFRSLGKGVNEFRKAKNEWEQDINDVMSQEPLEDHDFSESEKASKKESEESVPQEGEKQAAS
jgi:Sec-independent protein translocase protein TatA